MSSTAQTAKTIALAPAIAVNRQPVLQRKCSCGQHTASGECEECKKKKESGESGDPLLRRSAFSRNPVGEVPPSVHNAIRYQGRPLDQSIRTRLESSFQCELSRVRVHSDESAAQAATAINARAFTLGQNIWFGRNEFAPHSAGGFHLLAHEVAHTIQQGKQSPTVQRSLAIGSVDDPSEAAADRAADAAIASSSVPQLFSTPPMIRRRRIEYTPDPNVRYLVEDDNKTRYKVIRTYESVVVADSPSGAPKVKPGINAKNVWLTLEWCKNQKVQAEIGVNLPEEVKNLASQLYKAIGSGASASDITKNASLKPYLNVTITQSKSWQLAPGVHLTVNAHGDVTGGGGQIKFQKGPVKAVLGASSEKVESTGQQDKRVTANVIIDLDTPPPKVDCPKEKIHLEDRPVYSCVKESFVPPHEESKEIEKQVPDTRERYLYFIKSTDNLNPDVAGEGDLNKLNLSELRNDLGKGFKVSSITGFTSPEGPMKRAGTFEGNKALGLRRAKTALGIVRANCIPRSDEGCFAGDPEKMPVDGGELHTLVQKGKEVEGKRLASHAVDEFEGKVPKETSDVVNNPEETPQRSPELQKSLDKRATPEQQAELVFQKLRRAAITLTGTRTVKETSTTHVAGTFQKAGDCPEGIAGETFLSVEESLRGNN
jgi:Domain of unknown function (DUF4157)